MLHRPGVYPHHHLLRAPYRSLLRSDHRNGRGSSSQVNLAHSCLVATCFVSIRLPAHTHTQGASAAQSSSSLLLGTHPGFAARTASRTTKANSPQSTSSNLQPQGFKTSCPGLFISTSVRVRASSRRPVISLFCIALHHVPQPTSNHSRRIHSLRHPVQPVGYCTVS